VQQKEGVLMAITKKIIQSPEDFQTLDRLIKEIWPEVFTPIIGSDQVAYMLAHYQSPAAIQNAKAMPVKSLIGMRRSPQEKHCI